MSRHYLNCGDAELKEYKLQVSGHRDVLSNKRYTGLLHCGYGKVLKPLITEGRRQEVEFYTRLSNTTEPDLTELRTFVPKYYGYQKFTYNSYEQEYLILEDLTGGMLEPCIMDIKIGRITWDHLTTPEKIAKKKGRYKLCKEEFGFCIPGYQVFNVDTGRLQKYGKDHGRNLHGEMIRMALRNFLNGVGEPLCRTLVVRLLSALWQLQRWAARPRTLRMPAASLLLVYDAACLRRAKQKLQHEQTPTEPQSNSRPSTIVSKSFHSVDNPASGSNFSVQISSKAPIYRKLNASFTPLKELNHEESHSFKNNCEEEVSNIKMDYRATLDQLASETPNPRPWAIVRIIDFVHAIFHDEQEPTVDENFKEGLDNLVKIFESFLRETEDQIF